MSGITVLSPVAFNRVEARAIAQRTGSLSGVRLGLVNNNKPNAARLLEHVSRLLAEQHGVAGTLVKQKPNAAVGARDLDAYAQEVHAAVVAIGD